MSKPYDPKDFYYRKAKKEGLRARSAYKIEEISDRYHLLRRGLTVLDLGAAPGGWLQVMADKVAPGGTVVGVDLVAIAPLAKPNVKTAVLDARAPEFEAQLRALHPGPFGLVTSDMAPKTSGIKQVDEIRSLELCRLALETARKVLAPGGNFVCKVFMGAGFDAFVVECRRTFEKVKIMRPEATRERSFEHYIVGLSLRRQ